MRKFTGLLLLICCIVVSGCATTLDYSVNKDAYQIENIISKNIAIGTFIDNRPSDERNKRPRHGKDYFYTYDKSFKGNFGLLVAQSLATHMIKGEIFTQVEVVDISLDLENNEDAMNTLRNQGYDYAIIGGVAHCYGFQLIKGQSVGNLGAVGAIADAFINKRIIGWHVEYDQIKVVDLKNKTVLFSDRFEDQHKKPIVMYSDPTKYAKQGMRELNNKFIKVFVEKLQ